YPHLFRLALATPLASGILEVADEFLFLGVDRDHCLAFGQGAADLGVDVGELGIAIWMAVALAGLAVGLKAELLLPQQFAHDRVADAMPRAASSAANRRRLLQVQRNGDIGSPRASGSTSPFKSSRSFRSVTTSALRPPPERRTRPGSSRVGA